MNTQLFNVALRQYLNDFDQNWSKERYKWEAIKCFQDHWDLDAPDFPAMLEKALSKTDNLLDVGKKTMPRLMITVFARHDSERVRAMFRELFDESLSLAKRYGDFRAGAEQLLGDLHDPNAKNHYQTTNSVSVYLWLRYPDKYYLYKYMEYRSFDTKLETNAHFKANGSADEMIKGFELYDKINGLLRKNLKLVNEARKHIDSDSVYYPDPELRTLTFDFGFWVSRYFEPSNIIFTKMSPFIEEANVLLRNKKNLILQGAPGTGKTYNTAALALSIIDGVVPENHDEVMKRYDELRAQHRIEFTTFHQSMDYEDFVEGLKPTKDGNNIVYTVEDGLFKQICNAAKTASEVISSGTDELLQGINDHPTIWKVSLDGTGDNPTRTDCLENGHIRIGWASYGDIDFSETEDIPEGKYILRAYQRDMQIGDIVVSCYSQDETDAIGIVTGDYEYRPEGGNLPRYRDVKWIVKNIRENIKEINGGKHMTLGTVYRLSISLNDVLNIITKYSKPTKKSSERPYVLIIDEINRGNVSRIFGELITLLEKDKRIGAHHAIRLKLPYSKEDEAFGVPDNLYIIGTMNTTDRSTGTIDYALRRRFAFVTLPADPDLIEDETAKELFYDVKKFINSYRCADMDIDDLMIGHSYFMVADQTELKQNIIYEVIPLIKEYIKDGIISVRPQEATQWFNAWKNLNPKTEAIENDSKA